MKPFTCKVHVSPWTVTRPTASIHHRQTCIHSHYKWANSHAANRFHTPQANLCPLTLQMGQQSRGPPLPYTTGKPVSTHITNGPTVTRPTASIHHRQTCVHSHYKWANKTFISPLTFLYHYMGSRSLEQHVGIDNKYHLTALKVS